MDAGEWAEAEPGQDGGTKGGRPHSWGFGKLPLFWGVTLPAKDGVCSLGIHLDPVLTMGSQVASVVRSAFFHLRWIAHVGRGGAVG